MAVSGRLSATSITSSVLNTTKGQREAATRLAIHQTMGVKNQAPRSGMGSGRGNGTKVSGATNLKGGRF